MVDKFRAVLVAAVSVSIALVLIAAIFTLHPENQVVTDRFVVSVGPQGPAVVNLGSPEADEGFQVTWNGTVPADVEMWYANCSPGSSGSGYCLEASGVGYGGVFYSPDSYEHMAEVRVLANETGTVNVTVNYTIPWE